MVGELECSESSLGADSGGDLLGEYSAGGNVGSMRDVSGSGEPSRLLICGGGVIHVARGE